MQENQKATSTNKAVVNELKGIDPIYINKNQKKVENHEFWTKSKRGNSSLTRNRRRYSNRKWPKLIYRIKSAISRHALFSNKCCLTVMSSTVPTIIVVMSINSNRRSLLVID